MHSFRTKGILLLSLVVIFLTGCQELVLLQELDQNDANEVMVLLARNGIDVKKEAVEKQQATTWKVIVSPDEAQRARELLVANRVPRERALGLAGICKDAGLIPTPKTEKCRELLALKGELINSLETVPGVVNADVVINVPEKEDFPDENSPPSRPSASIVIQAGQVGHENVALTEAKIQQFVANAVPGMDLRDVTVIISAAVGSFPPTGPTATGGRGPAAEAAPDSSVTPSLETGDSEWVSVAGLSMDPRSARRFKIMAVSALVVLGLISVVLIGVIFNLSRLRGRSGGTALVPGAQALPERVEMDQLVAETSQKEGGRARHKA